MGEVATRSTAASENFAALLDESFGAGGGAFEGTVVKGTVVGIDGDYAIIDVGLKSEGRILIKEFGVARARRRKSSPATRSRCSSSATRTATAR